MSIADSLQLEYDDALVEEDVALLTENINAIQSELFARQMLKEKLEKKLSAETQKIKIESGYYRDQENNTEENDDTEELLYQPEELNTLTKQMLAAYLENRGDELKELLKEASGEATNGLSLHHDEHVFVNIRCGHGADYVLRLKLPEDITFGRVCVAAKQFFGIPEKVQVVLRDSAGNFFSEHVNMKNDFQYLPEQNLYLVHVNRPLLAELQQYQIGDMQNVHTGGLSRRKRDESRGLRVMLGLVGDLPKALLILVIMIIWTFIGDNPAQSATFQSKIRDIFYAPKFGQHYQFGFQDIKDMNMMWSFMEGPLINILSEDVIEDSTYILGSVRIRQQRVYSDSCKKRDFAKTESVDRCYDQYYGRSYGPLTTDDQGESEFWGHSQCNATSNTETAILAKSAFTNYFDDTLRASTGFITSTRAGFLNGALASYDPSGYYIEIGLGDRTVLLTTIQALKSCQWVDFATRVIYVEVNFFNPSMNMYQAGHIRFEIDPSGLVAPKLLYEGFRLDIVSQMSDKIAYGLEWVILIWCIYQINRWRHDWKVIIEDTGSIIQWFLNIWTILEAATVVVFLNVFVLKSFYLSNPHRLELLNVGRSNDDSDPLISHKFIFLGSMGYRYGQNILWMVIATFLASLKLLKYMKIGEAPRVLWTTLHYAAAPMVVFMLLYLLIVSGFVLYFHSVYGTRIQSFSTIMLSTRALFTSMVNHLVGETHQFKQITELPWSNNIMHPIMFVIFIIIGHFVLLNMFLAIMNDAHSVAHEITERTRGEYPQLSGYVFCYSLCGKYAARRRCGENTTFGDSDSEVSEDGEEFKEEFGEEEEDDDEAKSEDEDWRRTAAAAGGGGGGEIEMADR
jgi:hypothetical protein